MAGFSFMSQSVRLQYIIRCLYHKGGIDLAEIADEFEISKRQAGRDIEYLRFQMGAPVIYDRKEKKYKFASIWESYSNTDERIIITGAYLKSLFAKIHLGKYFEDEIYESIYSGIPDSVRRVLDRVEYRGTSIDVPDWNIVSTLIDAFAGNLCVEIEYTSLKSETSCRMIEPKRLINYNNSWYVAAYDYKRDDARTFHLSRIKKAVLAREKASHDIKLSEDGYGIYISDKLTEYRIKFTGNAARIVSTQVWSPSQRLETQDDGSLVMTLKSSSVEELVPAVLGFADEAEPLFPPSFVDEYRKRLSRMAEKNLGK